MIDTLYYGIGFLTYIAFCLITFDFYSKKKEITKIMALIVIYIYYTILAGYVISLVDAKATYSEKIVEIGLYAITGLLVSFFYYKNIISKNDEEANYENQNQNLL